MIDRLKIHVSDKGIFPLNRKKFDGEILFCRDYKVYIAKKGDNYLYVGKTKQTIGERFRGNFLTYKNSLQNEGAKDYSYKWIKEYLNDKTGLDLIVVKIETEDDDFAESVEAELVFLIRKETGNWPKFQHEIHFRNNEKAKRNALLIFEEINN